MSNVGSRGKPGENRRPRPIDRQLIQERARELRELVPNGTEVSDRKNYRLSEAKENSQSGKSWAFEFGDELQICPIVMLCDDRGVFLEIAQVIRSLDLTILKGVVESRSNLMTHGLNSLSRHGIFWPLMQLLQRRRNSITSKDLMHPYPVKYEGRLCFLSDELCVSELN
ncbi:hypothetical protein POTOM_060028 [Populus tomentosa]|uniref:BHLH domain-containing protein n=1 Tax=Populus tomentosa TaxID=118781 RepID=A0A8X8C1A1_POPTO|nr:hypothetical protein POTOM_060028 [Populus tomentosa]